MIYFINWFKGSGSPTFKEARRWLLQFPTESHKLLAALTDIIVDYLVGQANAGAQLLQVFQLYIIICLHIPQMDALLFPGRLRPGKRSASIGRRLCIYLALYSSNGCTSYLRFKQLREIIASIASVGFNIDCSQYLCKLY